jgi:4-oxalocrotonate tautomerase
MGATYQLIKKESIMPYVSIRVAGKLSREQKKNISQGVTEVIARETEKPESSILIFIDEEQRENIAKGGKLLDE